MMPIEELRERVLAIVQQHKAKQASLADDEEAYDSGEDQDYVPVELDGVLRSTEKLLSVNRGDEEPDQRDHLAFKRFLTPERMLAERIRVDAGKIRNGLLRNAAKTRNLKGVGPMAFNDYAEGLIVQNPMSMPLEEINPIHLLEQSRRSTQMGPGGVGSDDAITIEMQAVNASQFGFISPLEGPESGRAGVDTRFAWGTVIGSDGRIYQKFLDRRTGQMVWRSPDDVGFRTVKIPD